VQQQQQPFRGAAKERPVTFEEEGCVCVWGFFGLLREREREANGGGFFFFKIDWRRAETEMWLDAGKERRI
jgi:hypothetical protein